MWGRRREERNDVFVFLQTVDRVEQVDNLKMLLQLSSEANLGRWVIETMSTGQHTLGHTHTHTHTRTHTHTHTRTHAHTHAHTHTPVARRYRSATASPGRSSINHF